MSHRTAEGKALAGEARVWGLNKPTDYSQTEDWADQVKDLEYQKCMILIKSYKYKC